MKTTPEYFFHFFVLGNYYEFKSNPGDVRSGFNSVLSAAHMADHYFYYNKKYNPDKVISFQNIASFVKFVSQKTKLGFKDVRSIANAYKHLYTLDNPKTAIYSTVSSPGDIETITFQNKRSDIIEIREELAEDLSISKVVYTRTDGQQINLSDTLETVILFWQDFLQV